MPHELAYRVAARHLLRTAGVLEAPPAMHEAILTWIAAVLAANKIQNAQEHLTRYQEAQKTQMASAAKLLDLAGAFQAEPTWKNYGPLYEGLWLFGHPGQRWSVKDFQKMTPEKRADLERRAAGLLKHVEEGVASLKETYEASVGKASTELQEAQKYTQPGIEPMKGSVIKKFPVDLNGWRYDTAALKRKIDEMREKEKPKYRDLYERLKSVSKADQEMLDFILENAQKGGPDYDHITVELTLKTSDHFMANWAPGQRRMLIVVPGDASPRSVERLSKTLWHELRHFSQSYLAYAIGKELEHDSQRRPGLPALELQTPEYKQRYDPSSPGFKPNDPEMLKVYERLKSKGIDPKKVDWHALDDIEFYTRLADSIDLFRRQWQTYGSPAILNHAMRLWTDAVRMPPQDLHGKDRDKAIEAIGGYVVVREFKPDPFFVALRKRAGGKWRKAVAEFAKAVS